MKYYKKMKFGLTISSQEENGNWKETQYPEMFYNGIIYPHIDTYAPDKYGNMTKLWEPSIYNIDPHLAYTSLPINTIIIQSPEGYFQLRTDTRETRALAQYINNQIAHQKMLNTRQLLRTQEQLRLQEQEEKIAEFKEEKKKLKKLKSDLQSYITTFTDLNKRNKEKIDSLNRQLRNHNRNVKKTLQIDSEGDKLNSQILEINIIIENNNRIIRKVSEDIKHLNILINNQELLDDSDKYNLETLLKQYV